MIFLQGRIVTDLHKTCGCVYTPKHTWFYSTVNSVLREKVDLMHRLIVLFYFRQNALQEQKKAFTILGSVSRLYFSVLFN
jgi:hypothetical protein